MVELYFGPNEVGGKYNCLGIQSLAVIKLRYIRYDSST